MSINQNSGFFNAQRDTSGNYDRVYDASDFASYFSNFVSDGVFVSPVDQLKVIAKSGLTVTVKKGKAFIEGFWYELADDADITLPANSKANTIKDVVVVRLSKSSRTITLEVKEDVSATYPSVSGTEHELVLAEISVGVGVSSLTNAEITDRRPDKTYCGFVGALVTDIDTTSLYQQFTEQFMSWFNNLKTQFSEDAVGTILSSVNDLSERMDIAEEEISKRLKIKP